MTPLYPVSLPFSNTQTHRQTHKQHKTRFTEVANVPARYVPLEWLRARPAAAAYALLRAVERQDEDAHSMNIWMRAITEGADFVGLDAFGAEIVAACVASAPRDLTI